MEFDVPKFQLPNPSTNGAAHPPSPQEVPDGEDGKIKSPLKVFRFHGVLLTEKGSQAYGDCPLCGQDGKFFVGIETGLWNCMKCHATGNPVTFLRKLHEESAEQTDPDDLEELAKDRGLMYPKTLEQWGVCRSVITDEWLIPGYGVNGKLSQLYRYVQDPGSKKMKLWATPELPHAIHIPTTGKPKQNDKTVHVCEGPWDGMILWEALRSGKDVGENGEVKLTVTGNPEVSLLKDAAVIAPPGCSVWREVWNSLVNGKTATFWYDSDHPRVNPKTKKQEVPVGVGGIQRAVGILAAAGADKVKAVKYLEWGPNGYDKSLPDGTDIRDVLKEEDEPRGRFQALEGLLKKVKPIPEVWLAGKRNGLDLVPVECTDWKVLVNAWRKAMAWTDGLNYGLACMLSSIMSTKTAGSQLWLKVMAPASTGKTSLCEAVSVAKKYVVAKSTIRGLHSGFSANGGAEDNSLITKLYDKTLVIKDGDTLMQSPNLDQILAEFRDAYDRVARTSYRTGVNRDHENVNMTVILCGTGSLRKLDSSELGERFLNVNLMEGIDDDLEDQVAMRVAMRTIRNMRAGSVVVKQDDPDMMKAKQLTAGYIHHLRVNADRLLREIDIDEYSTRLFTRFGKFVAYMRARPSKSQDEVVEREFSSRLVEQLIRLGMCLTVVMGKTQFDQEVFGIVRKVALDTSYGRTKDIMKHLYNAGDDGLDLKQITRFTNESEDKERTLLKFLRKLGAVELHSPQKVRGVPVTPKWRLTAQLRSLWEDVIRGEK